MTEAMRARGLDADDYRATGYVVARGLFTPVEVTGWQRECERLWAEVADGKTASSRIQRRAHAAGGMIADRIDPVLDVSRPFARLANDPRVTAVVRSVLGAAPTLVKAKLIEKRPGTRGYQMHQDYPYWAWLGIPADEMVSVAVAIDAAHNGNGGVEVFPALHHGRLTPGAEEPLDVDERAVDLSTGEIPPLSSGDLLLFHSLTPHRSAPNASSESRRTLFLTYATARHGDVYARYHERGVAGH
jgi:ectoine hydroxylase-related dioxygenase (phytanoyl-CoA dioxygenase family)